MNFVVKQLVLKRSYNTGLKLFFASVELMPLGVSYSKVEYKKKVGLSGLFLCLLMFEFADERAHVYC